MNFSSIPGQLKELLRKLDFLALIDKDKKICTRSMEIVDSTSYWIALKRAFAGENRNNMLFYVSEIMNESMTALNEYKDSKFLGIILQKLQGARKGLENLAATYRDYPDIRTTLNVHILNIDLQLQTAKTTKN